MRNSTHPLYEITHKQLAGEFYLSQSAQSSLSLLAHISSSQDSGPSPNPSPAGRGVICEVTPIGLLVWGVGSLFFYAGYFFLSQNSQILQNLFAYSFELTERLRHTDITER